MSRLLFFALGSISTALVTVVACNGSTLDLGNDGESAEAGAPLDASVTSASSGSAEASEGDDETWSGYVENYAFPSGSDALTLTFTRLGDGGVTGHAFFGDVPLYPAATDGNVGYPIADAGRPSTSLEGFRFTLVGGSLDGNRFRATVNQTELYAGWCGLQTPYVVGIEDDGGPEYACSLPFATSFPPGAIDGGCYVAGEDGVDMLVNCSMEALCSFESPCECTASACTNNAVGLQPSFDFQINGAAAQGSVALGAGSPINLLLTQR